MQAQDATKQIEYAQELTTEVCFPPGEARLFLSAGARRRVMAKEKENKKREFGSCVAQQLRERHPALCDGDGPPN